MTRVPKTEPQGAPTEPGGTESPGEPRLDAARGWIAGAALAGTAVAYSFNLTTFLVAKELVLAVCVVGSGLLLLARTMRPSEPGRTAPGRARPAGVTAEAFRAFAPLWLLLAFALGVRVALMGVSVPSAALESGARMAMVLVMAATVLDLLKHDRWRKRLAAVFMLTASAVSALALLQYAGRLRWLFPEFPEYGQRAYSVFGNQNLLGGYLAMALPLFIHAVAKGRHPWPACAGLALTVPAWVLSSSRTAWLAGVVGMAVAAWDARRASQRRVAFAAALAFVLVAAVVLLAPDTTVRRVTEVSSERVGGRARVWIWTGTAGMVRDRPVAGRGLGNYAYWSPLYLARALHAPGGDRLFRNDRHAEHAHSDLLEVLAEHGVLGAVFLAWMAVRLLRRRGPEWGPLCAFAVFALFNAASRSTPHALAAALLAGSLLGRERRPGSATVPAGPLGAAMVLTAAGHIWAVVVPSALLRQAERADMAGEECLSLYARAVAHPWPNAQAREGYGLALVKAGRHGEALEQLKTALEGRDTGRLYYGLGLAALGAGDLEAARRWADACLYRWPSDSKAEALDLAVEEAKRRP